MLYSAFLVFQPLKTLYTAYHIHPFHTLMAQPLEAIWGSVLNSVLIKKKLNYILVLHICQLCLNRVTERSCHTQAGEILSPQIITQGHGPLTSLLQKKRRPLTQEDLKGLIH